MGKSLAQAFIALYEFGTFNHPFNCPCNRTALGVSMVHYDKTEQEYNDILSTAEG